MEILTIVLLLILLAELTYFITTNKQVGRSNGDQIFVDTSVLIDGRIVAVAEAGFVFGTLNIPRSVIGELQFLADNADVEKRNRARHGLDVVSELQNAKDLSVRIFPDGVRAEEGVDQRLLNLARKNKGSIMTIDYNLNKVAQVEDIKVLNVNELAMRLRMSYLPGEKMLLELNQKGQEQNQAVGHLPDGTMVVVEKANDRIGQTVEIEFIRSLQTSAGKMMFAKLVDGSPRQKQNVRQPRTDVRDKNRQNQPREDSRRNSANRNQPRRQNIRQNQEDNLINLVNNQNK